MGGRQLDSELGQALLCGSRMALAFVCAMTPVFVLMLNLVMRGNPAGAGRGMGGKIRVLPSSSSSSLADLVPLVLLVGCSLVVLCSSLSWCGAGVKCSCP